MIRVLFVCLGSKNLVIAEWGVTGQDDEEGQPHSGLLARFATAREKSIPDEEESE